ncbi:MAG: OmpA family protein [Bacteroidia bacterium]|nr:OmpA family protein [Bacteroidia bacterium]
MKISKFLIRLFSVFPLCILFHLADAQYYGIEKLNPAINSTGYDEISPKVSPDGSTLFFTRVGYPDYDKTLIINGVDWSNRISYGSKLRAIFQALGGSSTDNPETSDFNQDIWFANHNLGVFDKVSRAKYPLNNALPNSVCSFSADGQAVYVINQFGTNGGMEPGFSISRKTNRLQWTFPRPLEISDFYTHSSGIHMSMSEDESIVVMSLMRDDSYGGTDLYVSFKKADNFYTVPVNLGPDINSEYNEEAPFIFTDNKTIYFASDRPGIYGGKDIYKSVRLDPSWESWDEPYPLYEPINSKADDNQPYYHPGSSYLYFVSNRYRSSDIYRVNYTETLQEKDPLNVEYYKEVSVTAETPSSTKVDDGLEIFITTKHSETKKLIGTEITYKVTETELKTTATDGTAFISLPKNADLVIEATRNGFVSATSYIGKRSLEAIIEEGSVIELYLDTIHENGIITTDPIYFVQSKASIRKDSYGALNKLVKILNKHWNISISVEGHTDNQGLEDALQELSEKRAQAVRNYLVAKGISPLRIEAIGHGGKTPINDNSTEVLRSRNRRVEIIIRKVFQGSRDASSTG